MKELASGRTVSSHIGSKFERCEISPGARKLIETFEKPGRKKTWSPHRVPSLPFDSLQSPFFLPLLERRVTSGTSSTLLQHYIHFTALRISGRLVPYNPYLTEILPVALADDGVLHTILALSGAHLTYRSSAFDYHSRSHYAVAVRSVKHQLKRSEELDAKELMGLLTAVLFLCLFETATHKASHFYHLRASRHLLLHLRSKATSPHLLDFLVEQYAFLVITSTVCLDFDSTSPSLSVDRQLPLDPLLLDLDKLNRGSRIYGFMFGGAHQLFEMLYDTEQLLSYYETKIESWQFQAEQQDLLKADPSNENHYVYHYQTAGQICQSALPIFLFCAFHGPSAPSKSLLDKINPCLESFIRHMQSPPIDSPSREVIRGFFEEIKLEMWSCRTPLELLEFVWEDGQKDEKCFGLYGLELVMKRRRFNICIG
ncbi:uncharacterized protein PAC_13114 [Phialocephala subalpina]|uniref:Uncharacterized protein n=1 Tax=Phialocephala subalpina TaxID=576137 RepID=A0A1L7XE17_9HELO|nr:uncharacterized protein PAC_13114 [Phialocephala subalpina]